MRLANSNEVLSAHLNNLLATSDVARLELAKRMGVADGTLGRIKYGQANPTLDVLDRIAKFFHRQPWELLKPPEKGAGNLFAELSAMATPRSRAALDAISRAADEGRLTEADLLLLQQIAKRFMGE